MKTVKSIRLLLFLALLIGSQQVTAQGYYPPGYGSNAAPNIANYPGAIDRGYPVYGYPTYNQRAYPAQNPYRYQYPRNYYPQAPQSGYRPPQAAYGYPQQYPYSAPAYPPQAYAYPPQNNNGMNRMFKPNRWGGRNFGEEFWPGDDSIYHDVLPVHGPWDRNWGRAPWNREYADMWGKEGGPDAWMNFSDPKEGLAWMWEDFLYTPNALGTMPGGWEAPTMTVPNPVDVGDEFKNASKDFPGEMKNFSDGFTYGDRTMSGSKPNPDGGSFGLGKKQNGINIQPKTR